MEEAFQKEVQIDASLLFENGNGNHLAACGSGFFDHAEYSECDSVYCIGNRVFPVSLFYTGQGKR